MNLHQIDQINQSISQNFQCFIKGKDQLSEIQKTQTITDDKTQIDNMKSTDRLKDYIRNKDDELTRLNLNLTKQLDIEIVLRREKEQLQNELRESKKSYVEQIETNQKNKEDNYIDYQEKYQDIVGMYNEQRNTIAMDQQLINELSQVNSELKDELQILQNESQEQNMTQYNVYNNQQVIYSTNIKIDRKSENQQSFISESDCNNLSGYSGIRSKQDSQVSQMQAIIKQKSELISELKGTVDKYWKQIDELTEKNDNLNKLRCILSQKVKNLKQKIDIDHKYRQNEKEEEERKKVKLQKQIRQYDDKYECLSKEYDQLKKYNDDLHNQVLKSLQNVDTSTFNYQYSNINMSSDLNNVDAGYSVDYDIYPNRLYDKLKVTFTKQDKAVQFNYQEDLEISVNNENSDCGVDSDKSFKEKYIEQIYQGIKSIGEILTTIDQNDIDDVQLIYEKARTLGQQMWKQYKTIVELLLEQTLNQQLVCKNNGLVCNIQKYYIIDGQQYYQMVLINNKMQKIWMMEPTFIQLYQFHQQLGLSIKFPKSLRFYQKNDDNYQKQMSQIQDFMQLILISQMDINQQALTKVFLYDQITVKIKQTFQDLEPQLTMVSWESINQVSTSFKFLIESFNQQFMKLNQAFSKIKRDIEHIDESEFNQI